jgi:hypothetical protein
MDAPAEDVDSCGGSCSSRGAGMPQRGIFPVNEFLANYGAEGSIESLHVQICKIDQSYWERAANHLSMPTYPAISHPVERRWPELDL